MPGQGVPRIGAWAHLAGRVAPPPVLSLVPASSPGPLPVGAPLGKLPPEVRGRDGIIGELRRALRPYPRRASRAFVIAGMGGLGKSTVALTAARMARERGYRVWWVRAADSALLTSGMLEVLRELGAPESVTVPVREGARTAPERAWEFLNGDHHAGRRWLLVFDNADNPAVLAGADAGTPADGTGWLRPDPAGLVIVTSRVRDPRVWGAGLRCASCGRWTTRPAPRCCATWPRRWPIPAAARRASCPAAWAACRWRCTWRAPTWGHRSRAGPPSTATARPWTAFELPAALTDIEDRGADIHATVQRTWDLSLDALAAEGRPQARPLLLVLSCFAPADPHPGLAAAAAAAARTGRPCGGFRRWSRTTRAPRWPARSLAYRADRHRR